MRHVFLSIGHNRGRRLPWTTADEGASGNGTTEFLVTRMIVDEVLAKYRGELALIKVPEGLNLNQRVAFINKNAVDGDICIEFHLDSSPDRTIEGCSTWYYTGSDFAMKKARDFQMEYTRVTGIRGRGVHGDTTNRLGRLGFVRDTKPLALLFEQGFITNISDLGTIREKGSNAIVSALSKL
jgi:N-acetylmuramoyl-L-alanine amidase